MLRNRLLLAALLGVWLPAVASAAPLTINGWAPSTTTLGCQPAGDEGQTQCTSAPGQTASPGSGAFTLTGWDVSLDPDPTVVGFLGIQNNLAVAQAFTFVFLLPIVAQTPQVQIDGSIGGSVTNVGSPSATLSSTGLSPIYRAQIDGVTVQSLLPAVQNFTTASSTTWGGSPLGAFGPTILGIPANNNIAIRVDFTLSPGDIASFTSVFNVIAIPEPGTVLMLAGGLVGLLGFARRYRA